MCDLSDHWQTWRKILKSLFLIVLLNNVHTNNVIRSISYILSLDSIAKTNVLIDVEKQKCHASQQNRMNKKEPKGKNPQVGRCDLGNHMVLKCGYTLSLLCIFGSVDLQQVFLKESHFPLFGPLFFRRSILCFQDFQLLLPRDYFQLYNGYSFSWRLLLTGLNCHVTNAASILFNFIFCNMQFIAVCFEGVGMLISIYFLNVKCLFCLASKESAKGK